MAPTCKIATAPINISSGVNEPCEKMCDLQYNYGNASCTVTNKSTYLDIVCYDGTNTVDFGITGVVQPVGVRLYKPSLNSYDGFKADAELIITHTGGGRNLYICIPVNSSEASGPSAKWFAQVIPFYPTSKNAGKNINVENFTLNDVIPQGGFFIYEGGTFDWGCSANDVMIVFNKNKAITMKSKNYKTLVNLIGKASYNVSVTPSYLTFSKKGSMGGPGGGGSSGGSGGKEGTLTCTPVVDQYGNNIEGTDTSKFPYESTAKPGEATSEATKKMWASIYIILAVIGGLILITGLGYGLKILFEKWKRPSVLAVGKKG